LIRTSRAQNRFIGIEHLTHEEIEEYRASCEAAANKAAAREGPDARGEADPSTYRFHARDNPNMLKIRKRLNMSQTKLPGSASPGQPIPRARSSITSWRRHPPPLSMPETQKEPHPEIRAGLQ
jgi:hypothetical protein